MKKLNKIETALCRGCRKILNGKPYYKGGQAYIPITGEKAPSNFYGGFVCSEQCDIRVCLEMSSSMPGAGKAHSLNSIERKSILDNWA